MTHPKAKLILDAALAMAVRHTYQAMTRRHVALHMGASPSLISHYFGDMDGLRDEVMREAVARPHLQVLAQGIAARHPIAMRASAELRLRAMRNAASAHRGR